MLQPEYLPKLLTHLEEGQALLKLVQEEIAKAPLSPFDTPLHYLELPHRVVATLRRRGIKTAGELTEMTEDDLLKLSYIGEVKVAQIKDVLGGLGLSLAGLPDGSKSLRL